MKERVYDGAEETNLTAQEPLDLSALDSMNAEELRALVRRCCPDKARVLMMTEDQQGQAMIDMLAITALTTGDRKEARECGKEWLDRIKGKPVQRILEKTQRVEAAVDEERERQERIRRADEEADRIMQLVYERTKK